MPTNEIYKFLKDNNLTQKDEASFLKEYSDSAKAKELYGFMQGNGLTSKDFNSFYDTYFKKKDGGIPVTTISEDVLKTGFVNPSSVPSSATLSPLEIPRPQGQSEKVRVEAGTAAEKQIDPTKLGSFLPQDRMATPKSDLAAMPTQAKQTAKLMEEKPLIKERQEAVKKEAFENTLKSYSKGKKLSQAQLDTKAGELDKMLADGKLQIAKDPTTGKRILAYKDNNFFTSLWDSAKDVEKHRQNNVAFSKLDLAGKIKMVEEENAAEAPYLPEMPSGVGGALGKTVGELVTPLARPIAYGMAGVAAATMANAPAAYSAGASAVGSTIAFVEDMMYSGRAETFRRVYNGLLADKPNPTEQDKIQAAMQADKAAIGGAATGAAEAMLFGMPIAKLAKIEQAAGSYTSKIEGLTRHVMAESPKAAAIMGAGAGTRAAIAKESGAKDVDILGEAAEAAKGGVEMVVGFGVLKALPHALSVLGRTIVPPSKSITSQAKAIVSELPREEVLAVYEEGEKQGVFEQGTTKRVAEELKAYDEAKAAVPETVQKSETQDALAGKLEAKFKKEKELSETKIESRKREIEEEIAQIDKDIDAIYEGKPIEEHEYDVTGKKLSELKPVEFEEKVTTEEQFKEPLTEEVVQEESQVIPLQKEEISQDIALQKEEGSGIVGGEGLPKEQNFVQWANEKGYPTEYDTMLEAQLLGGRGLEGQRQSNRSIKQQDAKFEEMQEKAKQAKKEYEQEILSGRIIDPTGKVKAEDILKRDFDYKAKELQSKIDNAKSGIKNIEGLGKMSHLENGKLKKGYQRAVDDYNEKISNAETELNKLKEEYSSALEKLKQQQNVKENITGVAGEIGEGQESVQTKPIEEGSRKEIDTSGDVQGNAKEEIAPAKTLKDKFKDIADINLSDKNEVVKKREVTKYLKENPEIADVVKNFEKVTEYLKSEKELKVICD